jgi:N-acetylglutamate synthase-like GNAT family acetyltransferase
LFCRKPSLPWLGFVLSAHVLSYAQYNHAGKSVWALPRALQANITIRRALESDASGILECLRAAFEPYRAAYTPAAFADTVLTPETIRDRFGRMSVFVAVTADSQIVGTIACAVIKAGEGHLRGMAVLPEWHGHDIAEKLLQSAEAELARRQCPRVTLNTTDPLHRATRFYEKHGYAASGRTTDFFGMPLHEYVKELARYSSFTSGV